MERELLLMMIYWRSRNRATIRLDRNRIHGRQNSTNIRQSRESNEWASGVQVGYCFAACSRCLCCFS